MRWRSASGSPARPSTSSGTGIIMQQIEHFFTHYKDLEPKKWVRVGRWENAAFAKQLILESIARARTVDGVHG